MSDLKATATLDTSGMLCPMPVVKTAKKMKELNIGDILELISTDAGSMPDMKAWANQTKHELLESHDEGGRFRFLIKKTH